MADFTMRPRSGCRECRLSPERRAKQRRADERPENILSRSRCKARSFGLKWDISLDQLKAFKAMPCHYCEGPLEPTGMGLDRLEPKGDYVLSNVVPCCGLCNAMRSRTFSPQHMKKLGRVVKEIREECIAAGLPVPVAEPYRVRREQLAAKRAEEGIV